MFGTRQERTGSGVWSRYSNGGVGVYCLGHFMALINEPSHATSADSFSLS